MAARKTTARRAGQVHTWDGQADIWQGQYKLIARVPGQPGTWTVELLPDPPEITARIRDYYATTGHPFLPRGMTREQAAEAEITRRAERAGSRMPLKFISRRKWAEYF